MPAKDYQIAVSPLTGTVFITKVSKVNKNLMLSDRVEFPKNHFYQIIEQFAKANIAEGYSTLEVKDSKGNLVFELCLPNERYYLKQRDAQAQAKFILNYLEKPFDDPEAHLKMLAESAKSMANLVIELTK